MLGLSNTAGYAILALGCMQETSEAWVLSKDIAARTGISSMYLSKILHGLAKSGLILAKRGYRGGFRLSRPAAKISVLEVVEAVEGRTWAPRCLLGLTECSDEEACPVHVFWKVTRGKIEAQLRKLTVTQVADFEKRCAAGGIGRKAESPGLAGGVARRKAKKASRPRRPAPKAKRRTTVGRQSRKRPI